MTVDTNDPKKPGTLSLNKSRVDKTLKADHIVVTLSPAPEVSEKFKLSIETVSPDKNILMPEHTPITEATKASKNTLTPAEKLAEKKARVLLLAKWSAMESGGKSEDFQKLYSQWPDTEVKEFMYSGRFAKYIDQNLKSNVTGAADSHAILQGMEQYKAKQAEQAESEANTIRKLTGALVTSDTPDNLYATDEAIIAGKIYSRGLGAHFMSVMKRADEWKDSTPLSRARNFSREERAIFGNIAKLGLDPKRLTGAHAGKIMEDVKETIGGIGTTVDDKGDTYNTGMDVVSVVDNQISIQDNKNPMRGIVSVLGHFRRDVEMEASGREHVVSSHQLDVLPISPLANQDFMSKEFSLGSVMPQLPEYMQNIISVNAGMKYNAETGTKFRPGSMQKFKSQDPYVQQLNVLGLSPNAPYSEFFNVLAEKYADDEALSGLDEEKRKQVLSNLSGVISTKFIKNIKDIAIQNAMIMADNQTQLDALADEYGVEKARELFNPTRPVPYAKAYPELSEFVDTAFDKYIIQTRLDKSGKRAGYEQDLMSTLLRKGTHTISYNSFDDADYEHKEAIIERGALATIPKMIAKIYGYGDATEFGGIGRRTWEGGILPAKYFNEDQDLDEKEIRASIRSKVRRGESLDVYERNYMANTMDGDPFYQPKGALEPDYEDPNYSQEEIYARMLGYDDRNREDEDEEEVRIAEEEEEEEQNEDASTSDEFVGPRPLEEMTERQAQGVDDSFARQAPRVDVNAIEGEEASDVSRSAASNGSNFVNAEFIRQAFTGSGLSRPLADRDASEGSRVIPDTREGRLALAKQRYLSANPFVKEHAGEQGSDQWKAARAGMPTASEAWRFTAGDRKANEYLQEKAREGWGLQAAFEGNADTARGTALEDKIRKAYEKKTNTEVLEMGLLTNSLFPGGASLDGIVTKDGELTGKGVEFKAPRQFNNPNKYRDQMQMQMAISNLSEIDLVQGVEVNGKMETQTHNFKADKEWQKENKEAIREVQEALTKLRAMTQEEYLAANAEMAKDKSDKYPYFMRSKSNIEDDPSAKKEGGGAAGVKKKDPNAWRKGGVAADPTDAPREFFTSDSDGGSDFVDHKGNTRSVPSMISRKARSALGKAAIPIDLAIMATERLKEFSDDFIGPALDAGMNPGNFMSNVIGLQGQGLTDRQARTATTTLSNAYGDMQMGDFSAATSMVQQGMGYVDFDDFETYAQDPQGFFKEIKDRSSDLSPEAQASLFRKLNMEGLARMSLPDLHKSTVDGIPTATEGMYRGIQTGASALVTGGENMGNMGIGGVAAALSAALDNMAIGVNVSLTANGVQLTATDSKGNEATESYQAETVVQ